MSKCFEVNFDMLGYGFCGDAKDLENFCEILKDKLERKIRVIPIKSFGEITADTDVIISNDTWNKAIDTHSKRYPESWRF